MVKVELLDDVTESGHSMAEMMDLYKKVPGMAKPRLKIVKNARQGAVEYRKGTVVTMHETSAEKWVGRKIARVVL